MPIDSLSFESKLSPNGLQLNLEGTVKVGETARHHTADPRTPARYNETPQTKRSRQALEAPAGTSEPVVEAPNGT